MKQRFIYSSLFIFYVCTVSNKLRYGFILKSVRLYQLVIFYLLMCHCNQAQFGGSIGNQWRLLGILVGMKTCMVIKWTILKLKKGLIQKIAAKYVIARFVADVPFSYEVTQLLHCIEHVRRRGIACLLYRSHGSYCFLLGQLR